MINKRQSPSKFYKRLFNWFCKNEFYEELQGDLEEEFKLNSAEYSIGYANRIYRREVLKMVRPSVIRKVKYQKLNNIAMFKNYTLVTFRTLARNKLFSAINVFGLGISMAVALLTIAFVQEIDNYDDFHQNRDNIYRVTTSYITSGGAAYAYASSSLLVSEKVTENIAGIEKVVTVNGGFNGDFNFENQNFYTEGLYASSEFLNTFSFPLLQGNPETALKEPFSIVLTKETAQKIFGKIDVIGEILTRGEHQFTVTGILANIPFNSHLKFEVLGAMSSHKAMGSYQEDYFNGWSNIWNNHTYLFLNEQTKLESVQSALNQLALAENGKQDSGAEDMKLTLEGLMDIFPADNDKYNELGTVMPKKRVDAMIIMAIVVMFCACFNYTNLSLARSLKRAKEIGVRKVVGAKKGQIFIQFTMEAVIVSLLSLAVALLLFQVIKPLFLNLDSEISGTTSLLLNSSVYSYFFGFAILIGLVAGLIPALIMTKFQPISIIKGLSKMNKGTGVSFRKVLVGIQFALSMGFAILVTLSYQQYKFALNFDLGYATENVLNIPLQGNDPDIVKTALGQLAEVQSISKSSMIPSIGNLNSSRGHLINGLDSISVYLSTIDEDYIPNFEHEILVGQNFTGDLRMDQMIVNEEFIKQFKISSALDALGKKAQFYDGKREIIGVVKDFHYGTIYNAIKPFAFVRNQQDIQFINAKVRTDDMIGTIAKLEAIWSTIDKDHPFNPSFFHEQIETVYADYSSSMKTYGFLSLIAIAVSILGLLGMAVYTAESRVKELTIRKVLGATVQSLIILMSKNFLFIFIISAAIAIPASVYIYKETLLENAQYKMNIGFWELGTGAIIVICIAMLTIGLQSLKAAKTNPAQSLRNE